MKKIHLELAERSYDILIERGLLSRANEYFDLDRRVLILTDSGVPAEYAKTVASLCAEAKIVTVPTGENSKSIEVLSEVLSEMARFGLTRSDCAVAVGGGVVGDLCGFAAASYMRGIDFYNIPTTVLSQVDSSIGGKVAINHAGIKNLVGAFYQPRGVLIDSDLLRTLPKRQISNGLAESVKMALISDAELFSLFEREAVSEENIDEVIFRSLMIKKAVVEADEREGGIRKILNFGHTFGHGVEALSELLHSCSEPLCDAQPLSEKDDIGKSFENCSQTDKKDPDRALYHGECVAIGMTVACSEKVLARLVPVLSSLGLPYKFNGDTEKALSFISHDKKCEGDSLSVVLVDEIGMGKIEKITVADFCDKIRAKISASR